ncbi:MAG: bifunctional aspartate kinase/homoserine dehydrogenase I, partial [Bacteroidota bacterium]
VAQASSEGSLGLAVRAADADRAVAVLRKALVREIERGDVASVEAEAGMSVVAAVGTFPRDTPGLAGRYFVTLGQSDIDVRALAQGGGTHTISALVPDADATQAVRALHEAFARGRVRAHVVVVGAGTLGRRFLDLLGERAGPLRDAGLNLQFVGLATSTRFVHDAAGMLPADALARLGEAPHAIRGVLDEVVAWATDARLERLVVVDATASPEVAARHADLLGAGIAVVTPNKEATGRPVAAWRQAEAAARAGEAPYLYDASVGAGLGVVARLRDLVRTGDTVREIEGVLSGTLAFVFSRLRAGVPFSEAVAQARDAGLTEPDVRDDLSGRDVARKLALLAREMGRSVDPGDADVESLVPEGLEDVDLETFWTRLPEADVAWTDRLGEAPGAEFQYVARLRADGSIRARVEAVRTEAGSLLAALRDNEIAVVFHTDRTGDHPFFLQGPGADIDVTASVLLADVVRAAEAMR